MTQFISNPNLETILSPTEWKGTPVSKAGRYVNHEHPLEMNYTDVLKWQLTANPDKALKKQESWRLQPVPYNDWLTSNVDCIVWLGHTVVSLLGWMGPPCSSTRCSAIYRSSSNAS